MRSGLTPVTMAVALAAAEASTDAGADAADGFMLFDGVENHGERCHTDHNPQRYGLEQRFDSDLLD